MRGSDSRLVPFPYAAPDSWLSGFATARGCAPEHDCKHHLVKYRRPVHVALVSELPLTPARKVDARRLQEMARERWAPAASRWHDGGGDTTR
jgi:acyl-CoA synthetase (AMP-forming)/AMP-acid ligase II